MSIKHNLTIGALAALTLATAAGCGTTGLTPMAAGFGSHTGAINVMGVERKLGLDLHKESLVMAHAHPIHLPHQAMLPTAVDNRKWCSPIADQGQLGSCTAFAMGKGLREYMQIKEGNSLVPMSALFMYYVERDLDGDVDQDGGSTMAQGMNVLKTVGCAPEADWAYDISKFTEKPPAKAYADAGAFKIQQDAQIANLDDIKTAVANGDAVVFGIAVYSSFENIGANGMMPMPKKGEQLLGGHAQHVVGYNDAKQVLIIRNSWGTGWGDQGYYYMPYKYVTSANSTNQYVSDIWTAHS